MSVARLTLPGALPTIAPPIFLTILGAIAQLGERYNGIVEVGSSILPGSTTLTTAHTVATRQLAG